MHTVLLVEDDPEIAILLHLHFNPDIYKLTFATNKKEALEKISAANYSLIILDIRLPDGNGFEICKKVREDDPQTPIMMLTCLSQESDKVLALQLGADDYVTKPFGIMELMARVKALLRRNSRYQSNGEEKTKEIVHHELHIEIDKRKATLKGIRLDLTVKEFDLLFLLASHPGKTFTREELLKNIWGLTFPGYEHTVTAHINRLRMKIETDLNYPAYILTTWGTGYRFAE